MLSRLLETKLHIPSLRPTFVSRPRLVDKLNDGLSGRLTLVSAPAGFGKTALLAEWVRSCPRSVAWLSLEEADSDPSRFWTYFVGSLQGIKRDVGSTALACLNSSVPQPIEACLVALVNNISDEMPAFVVVLDDYHAIVSSRVQDSVEFVLDHIPSQMHMVISGRSDPPLSLSRFRARGELTEIRSADLRFTVAETSAFLNDIMELGLSGRDIDTLVDKTEGWAASLQMTGISMQDRPDLPGFVSNFSGSHRFVLDYLTDEVLSRQEEDVRSFLLQSSVLQRMTSPLCDAVTERNDSRDMLSRLDRLNLFIVPLDDERRWYRYHHLFRDLLLAQLRATHPGLELALHSRASHWFEREGLTQEAVHHAMKAGDNSRAADLVERMADQLLEQGQISTLHGWATKIGDSEVLKRPWLTVCVAWATILSGQPREARKYLESASTGLTQQASSHVSSHNAARVRGHLLTIGAYASRSRGDVNQSIRLATEAESSLPQDDLVGRSANTLNLGIAHHMVGDVAKAEMYFEEAAGRSLEGGNFYVALESMSSLGDLRSEAGRLRYAAHDYERALELGRKHGGNHPLPATSHAYHGLGRLQYEWNNLERAQESAVKSVELSEAARLPLAYKYTSLAHILEALGHAEAADEAMTKAERSVEAGTIDETHISSWKARLFLRRNDAESLHRWTASVEKSIDASAIPEYWIEMPYLTFAEARLHLGYVDHLPDLLIRLRDKAMSQGRIRSTIEISLLQALVHKKLGSQEKALKALEDALGIARPERFARIFIDRGLPLLQLLRAAAREGVQRDYTQHLISAFVLSDATQAKMDTAVEYGEQINEREKEILRLLAAGSSNRVIASRLYISPNTVKWHISHLFEKLGVHNRAEAVSRARDLDVL